MDIRWTPVREYADKIANWGLALEGRQIRDLAANLPDHAGPFQPTGISLTLGANAQECYRILAGVLQREFAKVGGAFRGSLNIDSLAYYPGSEPEVRLAPALLDIGPRLDIPASEVRKQLRGHRLPAFEVGWLMALNAELFANTGYWEVPNLLAPGLSVRQVGVPLFERHEAVVDTGFYWSDECSLSASAVLFRE